MIVLPAIDLRGGRCVRLFQGDLTQETVYGDDPVAMARRWEAEGGEWLHLVDLDGAVSGTPAHLDTLRTIAGRLTIPIEFGGGVRTLDDVRALRAAQGSGIAAAIIGRALYTGAVRLADAIAAAR